MDMNAIRRNFEDRVERARLAKIYEFYEREERGEICDWLALNSLDPKALAARASTVSDVEAAWPVEILARSPP